MFHMQFVQLILALDEEYGNVVANNICVTSVHWNHVRCVVSGYFTKVALISKQPNGEPMDISHSVSAPSTTCNS
jgi:hypothetical protein